MRSFKATWMGMYKACYLKNKDKCLICKYVKFCDFIYTHQSVCDEQPQISEGDWKTINWIPYKKIHSDVKQRLQKLYLQFLIEKG